MKEAANPSAGLREGTNLPSPFTRVLALGYYDGPTNGLVLCGPSGPAYTFDYLDGDDLRIFRLAPLPLTSWSEVVDAYADHQQPRWPVWVPSGDFLFLPDVEARVKEALNRAEPTKWVIACPDDLRGTLVLVRAITPGEITTVAHWPSFLGLLPQEPWLQSGSAIPSVR